MMMSLKGVSWGALDNMVVVLPCLVVAAWLLFYRVRKTERVIAMLSSRNLTSLFVRNYNPTRMWGKALLFFMAVVCISCALLVPRWGKKEQVVQQEGRDLLIALDISRSMLAQDCAPDRLTHAKEKIKRMLTMLSCERVGLILFSGSAFVQCPLTSDYNAFLLFLDQIDVETIASGGTALDQAMKEAIRVYQEVPERKNKLLVVVTDGEDFSHDMTTIKRQATALNVCMFTCGVGTKEGAPIPLYDKDGKQSGHLRDEKGAVVISRLNQDLLHTLATESGGHYITMTSDDTDAKRLVNYVQAFEKEGFLDKKVSSLQERYYYFVGIGFICLLLEWLL